MQKEEFNGLLGPHRAYTLNLPSLLSLEKKGFPSGKYKQFIHTYRVKCCIKKTKQKKKHLPATNICKLKCGFNDHC